MRNLAITGTVLTMVAASAIASAQGGLPDLTPYNISIRAGASFAIDGPLADQQNMWFGVGVDYNLGNWLPNATTYISGDWIGKSGSGGHGNYFPICINERFNIGQKDMKNQPYAFVGAGIVIMDVTSSNTVGGARFGLGCNFNQNFFGEVALLIGGQADGVQPTSFGVYVGYRF
jgi:hypothetical protein